jgi:hypothetical protein
VAAIHNAALKLSSFSRQGESSSYHVFEGGDHDLLFIPVTANYALLLAGEGLASEANILDVVKSMIAVRNEVQKALKALSGVAEAAASPESRAPVSATTNVKSTPVVIPPPPVTISEEELAATKPAEDLAALLSGAIEKKTTPQNASSFWDDAVEKVGNKPVKSDVMSYEDAVKRGLTPGEQK